ncbi:MAG: hypothetical protein ACLP6G_07395 [Terriglobales bacterium]
MGPGTPDLTQGRALAFELECAAQPRYRTLLLEHSAVPTLRLVAAFTNVHICDHFDDHAPVDVDRIWQIFARAGTKVMYRPDIKPVPLTVYLPPRARQN